MNRGTFRIVAAAIAVGLLATAAARLGLAKDSDEQPLRWRFVADETLVMRVEQKMNMTMKMGGDAGAAEVPTNGDTTIEMTLHVDKVNEDGSARVTMKMSRMKMAMKAAGMEMDFDSAKKDAKEENPLQGMMSKAFSALLNLSYSATINARGEFSDIDVPEASITALKGLPGMEGLQGLFDEKTFKESFTQVTGNGWLVLPEKPPVVGDTWKQESSMKNPVLGKQTMLAEYKYEGEVEKDGKKLDEFSVTIDMTIEPDPESKFPAKIDIEDQSQSGKIYFDRSLGRIDHGEMTTKMKMAIEAMGQNITQNVTATTITSLVPATEAEKSPGDEAAAEAAEEPKKDE